MKHILRSLLTIATVFVATSCDFNSSIVDADPATSSDAAPNYEMVFPQDKVNELEITLTAESWATIKADMITKAGYDFGTKAGQTAGGNAQGGGATGGTPPTGGMGGTPPTGTGGQTGGMGGVAPGGNGASLDLITGTPVWVKSTVKFGGKEWQNVGFRLKGNSSLAQSWGAGIYKLPFKLEFDHFEDEIPAIKNQRFYGFKQVSMAPGQGDNTLIKDKIIADLFREAGIPAARTAFYKISINFGDGVKYCGVYTMDEMINDTMINDPFGEEDGNMYKPESDFVSFLQSAFEKKNNETAADYSDVQAAITALNATNRTSDPVAWRANLEKTFNVDHFLKYLAINNTIVNWDAYGAMAHNYYLYTPKKTGKVTWIPWDFNLSMISGTSAGGQSGNAVSLEMTEVTTKWPLIRYLADDATYLTKYKAYVKDFNTNYFQSSRMNGIIDKQVNLISAAVAQEVAPYSYLTSYGDFTAATATLKQHIVTRNQAVTTYLNK
jgi:spore coat protein H